MVTEKLTESPDVITDFCVVGGGPAGLTLALLLLRSGKRVAVVERSRSFEREYRGEILQPGGQRLLDQLGALTGARERGGHEHRRFLLEEHGKVLINGDYRIFPPPFNCLLSVPQRHVLEELLERCRAYDTFEYLDGARAAELVTEGDQIRGIVCGDAARRRTVLAHCVIGADGRYSKVRRLAGIGYDRLDRFGQDVLWFRLSAGDTPPSDVRVFRAGGNPVLAYTSVPNMIQFGWTFPHGGYRSLSERGIGYVKERLREAVPDYADQIDAEITGFGDLSMLDVFIGRARRWAANGLLLIGDSAHTQGPIGAQGINLAIQDAVAVHPVLLESLRNADASAGFFDRFTGRRMKDIARVSKIQFMQSKMMLATSRSASWFRPKMAALVSRTPLYRGVFRQIAFGNQGIEVRSDLFAS